MKLILVLIVLLNALEAQSGHNDKTSYSISGTGIISGTVIHDNTGDPIEYASVTLHNKESNEIIEGQLTDELGFFLFQKISNGYYFVEINFMGVKPWKSNEIHISKKNSRIDIGRIELQNKLTDLTSLSNRISKKNIYP